jgi:hypothetical protein
MKGNSMNQKILVEFFVNEDERIKQRGYWVDFVNHHNVFCIVIDIKTGRIHLVHYSRIKVIDPNYAQD